MTLRRTIGVSFGLALLPIVAAMAQEGFPLDGTWRGAWGTGAQEMPVVIVMKWNGEAITGLINPGRNSVPFTAAELYPTDWTVRFEARVPAEAGDAQVVIAGKLDDLGSYNRTITGTWTQNGIESPFRLRRE